MFIRTHSRRATDTPAALQRKGLALSLYASAGICVLAQDVWAEQAPVYETVVRPQNNAFVSADDKAASASVISKNRTPRSGESVEQLVAELPGVAVTRYGGNGATSTLSVRGSTANQVQVYVDGIPMNLATGGGIDLGFLPLMGMGQLELFKGSSPIAFGSSGIGGILSITTETPETNLVRGAVGFGSWGGRSLVVAGSYVLPRVRAFVSVSSMGWKGDFKYENDDGLRLTSNSKEVVTRANNDSSQQDALVRLVFVLNSTRTLSLVASLNQRDQGVPGYGLLRTQFTRLGLTRQTAQIAYEGSSDLGPRSRLRGNLYVLRMGQDFADWLGEYGVRTDTHDVHRAIGSTWRLTRDFDFCRVAGVLDARHEEFQPTDSFQSVPSGPPGTRDAAAVGIEPTLRSSRLRTEVSPSLRFELSRDAIATRSMFTNKPITSEPKTILLPVMRLSLTQAVGEHVSLRSNVGRYVRAPSITERYGNTGYILPNPTLEPERGLNTDVGARVVFRRSGIEFQSDTALFASWVDDLIQYKQNAQGKARAQNLGEAEIKGVEAAVSLSAIGRLRLFAQSTYTHAIDTSGTPSTDGKQLPLRPKVRAYCRPEITNVGLGSTFVVGIYADADYTGSNFVDSPNLLKNRRRLLFGAGTHLIHKRSGVRAVLSANNLGDVMAYDYTGFPLPGRSVFLSLDWLTSFPEVNNATAPEGAS